LALNHGRLELITRSASVKESLLLLRIFGIFMHHRKFFCTYTYALIGIGALIFYSHSLSGMSASLCLMNKQFTVGEHQKGHFT
jgi:hypothetical protein